MPRFLLQQDAVFSREVDAPDAATAAALGEQSDPITDSWERNWVTLEVTPMNAQGEPLYDETQSAEELLRSGPPTPPASSEETPDAPPPPPPMEL